jgi:hypothetical protein
VLDEHLAVGDGEPLLLEAPAAFIWHALNAYE